MPNNLPNDKNTFESQLKFSIQQWRNEDIKVIWITIPIEKSDFISIPVNQGFAYHHATSEQITLTKSLMKNTIIPPYANHTIGAGAVVTNDKNQLLTVVEKIDMQTRPEHFKFPGGMLDPNELICDGVVREVFEETGIQTKLLGFVGFRHHHKGQFSTSNIYAVCHLQALSEKITACPIEIGLAKWMDIEEYLATKSVLEFNKVMLRATLQQQYLQPLQLEGYMQNQLDGYEIFLAQNK